MTKLISINQNVDKLVKEAKASNQKAQLALYDRYSAKMLGACRQYIKDLQYAEDVMITAFHKALLNIKKYEPHGSFEAWLRQIMVRECISYLRIQKNKFNTVEISDSYFTQKPQHILCEDFDTVQHAIDQLPVGCKTIFNLYVIEGYKHQEIADLLGISAGTSKSQLAHAKKLLRKHLLNLNSKYNNGTE